ncbi:MAG TPA: peptidylprolyl isomerase [Chitinophagaceae bacterium]|nr:peptidylprolyl isomerase [Chitinophagaceae bacterium]
MKKNWLTAILILFALVNVNSQTLFTYGKYKADAKEFLRAFNKNNQQPASNKSRAIREYLDLYINSRLKIREAYDRGYDTLPAIKNEIENLRSQVIENYMSDPAAISRLTKEAFKRSLKDIHVAHIFISLNNASGKPDSTAARKKIGEVTKRLARGEDFLKVAQQLSDDPAAKVNKGDLNYITVFTLPYELENIVYSTTPGKFSKPYLSKVGYHMFKNLGERKALGTIKVQQILLAFPPGTQESAKKNIHRLADSIHRRIQAGESFAKLASSFSNDNVSAASDGNVPEISVGQYDPSFEKTIWSLKDGSVSKPFETDYGYHIVKRISAKPIVTNAADKANAEELQQKIMSDDRWKTAKNFIYDQIKKKGLFHKSTYNEAALWALSDSLLDSKPPGIGKTMSTSSPLFRIGDSTFRVMEWIGYAQMNRFKADRATLKAYPEVMDEFVKNSMDQYYRWHLEDFNDDFRTQMNEFRDGNLFFEIMQQEVWNKAQNDSAALQALYEKNKNQYNWKQSADAVIFFCSDEAAAKDLYNQMKKDPTSWRKAVEAVSERVVADSARYEWSQIPGIEGKTPVSGMITALTVNPADKTASFSLISKVYEQSSPRSFNEAKGLVMNDYQTTLEQEWVKELKKKYPVVVDQKVLAQVLK